MEDREKDVVAWPKDALGNDTAVPVCVGVFEANALLASSTCENEGDDKEELLACGCGGTMVAMVVAMVDRGTRFADLPVDEIKYV